MSKQALVGRFDRVGQRGPAGRRAVPGVRVGSALGRTGGGAVGHGGGVPGRGPLTAASAVQVNIIVRT